MSEPQPSQEPFALIFESRTPVGPDHDAARASVFASLRRYCLGLLNDTHVAEDLAQETLARALQATTHPEEPRAFAFRIARNLCFSHMRKAGVRELEKPQPTHFDIARETAGPLTRMVRVEEAERLDRALERLNPAQREALHLRYIEDLARHEVALVLELPESTVKSRLFEASKRMRELLEEPG